MVDPATFVSIHIGEAIDAAKKLAESINRGPGGREVALVITKLEEAALWLRQAQEIID